MHPLRWGTLLTAPMSLVMPRVMSRHVRWATSAHGRSSMLWWSGVATSSALLWHALPYHLRPQIH